MNNNYLVFDVGGTLIKYAIFSSNVKILEMKTCDTPDNIEDFRNIITNIIDEYKSKISGVSFSIPGRVNQKTKTIYGGGALTYLHEKCISSLFNLHNIPVAIENDGKCGALAELWLGNLKEVENGALITLGTGIGGGIILNSQLYRGMTYSAGELSIMRNAFEFELNNIYGFTGSAVNMIKDINMNVLKIDSSDGLLAFEQIYNGNEEAMKIFHNFCENIAIVIFNMQTILDLECVVLSGGICKQNIVLDMIDKKVSQLFSQNVIIENTISKPKILLSKFESDSNLHGALYNLFLNIENEVKHEK